jgi:hypothetical protein
MNSRSRTKVRASLEALQRRRARLLEAFLQDDELAVGTVSEVLARCGKPGCHCVREKGHPQMRLLYAEDGTRKCKLIRQADMDRIREAGERYRVLKGALRETRALNLRELRLLRELIQRRAIRYS